MQIANKTKRGFIIKKDPNDENTYFLKKGCMVELSDEQGKKLVNMYPGQLEIVADPAKMKDLEKENAELKAKLEAQSEDETPDPEVEAKEILKAKKKDLKELKKALKVEEVEEVQEELKVKIAELDKEING